MVTLDFETEAIVGNPIVTPPKPVGLAVKDPILGSVYLTNLADIEKYLKELWSSDQEMLFHNAPFDLSVAREHFGLPWPDWRRVHDTLYLIFLADPYADSLSLKPSAERILGEPPTERDTLVEWILTHVPGATKKNAGAHISKAPVELVAPYAIGDVERTFRLFQHLHKPEIVEPYDRERRLAPIIAEASQHGIRVDRERLARDLEIYSAAQVLCTQRLQGMLGPINFNSPLQLGEALERKGFSLPRTEKGNISTAKDALLESITDAQLLYHLLYHSTLDTILGTFMVPWADLSSRTGRLHPEWNAVRGDKHGTRTGRLSCSNPNLQNVPNELKIPVLEGLPPLPLMRQYLLPDEGHVWLKRDFSSQEVRILAHFEDGQLMRAYKENPSLDPHETARQMIKSVTGLEYLRKDVKITAFSTIYGAGVRSLAEQLKRPQGEAKQIRDSYFSAFPGVQDLQRRVTNRIRNGGTIKTWGGRTYAGEKAKWSEQYGRMLDFSYKMVNTLIQGSAADQTKESINEWYDCRDTDSRLLATVHDEICISAPADEAVRAMGELRTAMDADRFDVPFRSEGFVGPNWSDLENME